MNSEVFTYSNDSYRFYLDLCRPFFQFFIAYDEYLQNLLHVAMTQFVPRPNRNHFTLRRQLTWHMFGFSFFTSHGSFICNYRSVHCNSSYLKSAEPSRAPLWRYKVMPRGNEDKTLTCWLLWWFCFTLVWLHTLFYISLHTGDLLSIFYPLPIQ